MKTTTDKGKDIFATSQRQTSNPAQRSKFGRNHAGLESLQSPQSLYAETKRVQTTQNRMALGIASPRLDSAGFVNSLVPPGHSTGRSFVQRMLRNVN